MVKKGQITILRPSGNDTALINSIPTAANRKRLNNAVMQAFPNVEQVGFYTYNTEKNQAELMMAGGEFCGNALRSLAFLLLRNTTSSVFTRVSGTNAILKAGVKPNGVVFASLPIARARVEKLANELIRVSMEGITHLITTQYAAVSDQEQLKQLGKDMLAQQNLLKTVKAAGVMFVKKEKNETVIRPVVFVRDIQTIFFETACASGTTAVGLWEAEKKGQSSFSALYKQPSGEKLTVTLEKEPQKPLRAEIEGKVTFLQKKTFRFEKGVLYV